MVGRGVRTTNKIYKDNCILIDGGENIDRFQEFSDPTRDWNKIFWDGIGKIKSKKDDSTDVKTCNNCGALIKKSLFECPECGYSEEIKIKTKIVSDDVLTPIIKIPLPNGEKIYNYTKSQNEDVNFAFKILINQILDLFQFYAVSKEKYIASKESGKLEKRIKQLVQNCYFILISKYDIKASNNRTMNYIISKILTKLVNKYEI
jgi:hypothetical protein